MFLSIVLSDAFTDPTQGVWIHRGPEVNLFNACQFKSARKTRNVLIRKLMIVNDTTFKAHNQEAQETITRHSKFAKAFGFKINHKKTEIMNQPLSGSHDR